MPCVSRPRPPMPRARCAAGLTPASCQPLHATRRNATTKTLGPRAQRCWPPCGPSSDCSDGVCMQRGRGDAPVRSLPLLFHHPPHATPAWPRAPPSTPFLLTPQPCRLQCSGPEGWGGGGQLRVCDVYETVIGNNVPSSQARGRGWGGAAHRARAERAGRGDEHQSSSVIRAGRGGAPVRPAGRRGKTGHEGRAGEGLVGDSHSDTATLTLLAVTG